MKQLKDLPWFGRLVVGAVSLAVRRLRLPAKWFGFVVLGVADQKLESGSEHPTAIRVEYPLPFGVATSAELPTGAIFGRSFESARCRVLRPTKVARHHDAKVATYFDKWDNVFSLVLNRNDRILPVDLVEPDGGSGWKLAGRHARLLRKHRTCLQRSDRAAFLFQNWCGNYYHWLVYHLPRAYVLSRDCPGLPVLVPTAQQLPNVVALTLPIFNLGSSMQIPLHEGVISLRECVHVTMDLHPPPELRAVSTRLRNAFAQPWRTSPRRIYVSRKAARWRRLVNEEQVINLLVDYDFEVVAFEALDFAEQVAICATAEIIAGAHGAGLTNMMFAPQGAIVVEFVSERFPNSDYYSLANALGHHYAMARAEAVGAVQDVAYDDISVPIDTLRPVILRAIALQHVYGKSATKMAM